MVRACVSSSIRCMVAYRYSTKNPTKFTFSQRKPTNLAIKLYTNHVLRVRRHGDLRMWCEEGRPLVAHSMMYPVEKVMCCYGREKECAEATFPSYVAFSLLG